MPLFQNYGCIPLFTTIPFKAVDRGGGLGFRPHPKIFSYNKIEWF